MSARTRPRTLNALRLKPAPGAQTGISFTASEHGERAGREGAGARKARSVLLLTYREKVDKH